MTGHLPLAASKTDRLLDLTIVTMSTLTRLLLAALANILTSDTTATHLLAPLLAKALMTIVTLSKTVATTAMTTVFPRAAMTGMWSVASTLTVRGNDTPALRLPADPQWSAVNHP